MKKFLSEDGFIMQKRTLGRLLCVAKGEAPPDSIVTNGRIVNVFTNSIDEGLAIAVKDGYITGIDKQENLKASKKTVLIDARGRYLCPGFMDAHTHLDSMYPFY
jgi:adenine deaminase